MAQPVLSSRNLLVGVIAVAVLYGWWVASQYQRLNALNQRELAATAVELKTTIETALGSIKLYDPGSGGATAACDFDYDQPYLDMVVNKCADEKTKWIKPRMALGADVQVRAYREGEAAPAAVTFRFRTDLLFSELAFTERFDRVFVADNNGKVVYQEDPSRQQRLRLMRWAERRFRDARAGETRGLAVQTVAELIGKDADPGWARLRAVSDRTTTTFAGTRYQLYSHPIGIDDGEGTSLVLVGVVPVSTVLRQALAFDTSLVAVLVFLALMTALGVPFVKLAMLHSHERFRMLDVRMQYISCAALLVVFAFAVLAADGYTRWRRAADDGLRQIADDMRTGMLKEIERTRDVLVEFDHRAAALGSGNPRCNPKKEPVVNWFNEPERAQQLGFPRDDELFLDQVSWLGRDGIQIWKITSDRLGEKVDVSRRAYYRAVRDGGLFELPSGPAFFIGPERSITDGKFYSFVSVRSALTDYVCPSDLAAGEERFDAASANPYVAVATVRLLSIDRRPLPAGYGFAVIARDGRVLYHSDGRLSLRENFFDELTSWADARSVVYGGNTAVFGTRYRERPHRVHLQPLGLNTRRQSGELIPDQVGLYIATFRDMSMEQSVVSRAFLISLAGPFAFLLAMVGPGLWLTSRLSKRLHGSRNHWLWPQGAFEPLYKRLALMFGAIHLACVVLALLGIGIWSYVVLPMLTVGSGLYVYARDTSHRVPRRKLTQPVWFITYFSLLALNTLVTPALFMFNATLGHEFGTLLSTEQRWMGDQIEDAHLEREAEARAERIPVPVAVGRRSEAQRQRKLEDWPAPFNVKPYEIQSATLGLINAHEQLDRWLPFDSEAAVRLRYQATERVYSPPGLFGLPIGLVGVCGWSLLAAGFWFWLRWMSTRLLFANVASKPELHPLLARAVFERCSEPERHLMMQIAEEGIANPRQRSLVVGLMEKGLIRLNPDLQLSSSTIRDHVRSLLEGKDTKAAHSAWENPHNGRNWHDGRNLLLVALAVVALLVATQPGLPSELAAVASGVATAGAAGLKVRDVFVEWLQKGRKA